MADEKKYIEQGAALDAVFGQFCASSDETERALNAAIEEIRAIPAADVVPVVRCKDCKHYQHDAFLDHDWCDGRCVTPDYFCADGERKKRKERRSIKWQK